MSLNTATDSLETTQPKTTGGLAVGQSATDLVGFWGATPVDQPASADQMILDDDTSATPDAEGDIAAAAAGACAGGATPSAAQVDTAIATALAPIDINFATMVVLVNEIRRALVEVGIMKGSA
jgi:hypothetical protein